MSDIVTKKWELIIDDDTPFEGIKAIIDYKVNNLPIDQYMYIHRGTEFSYFRRCNKNRHHKIYGLTSKFECVKLY